MGGITGIRTVLVLRIGRLSRVGAALYVLPLGPLVHVRRHCAILVAYVSRVRADQLDRYDDTLDVSKRFGMQPTTHRPRWVISSRITPKRVVPTRRITPLDKQDFIDMHETSVKLIA